MATRENAEEQQRHDTGSAAVADQGPRNAAPADAAAIIPAQDAAPPAQVGGARDRDGDPDRPNADEQEGVPEGAGAGDAVVVENADAGAAAEEEVDEAEQERAQEQDEDKKRCDREKKMQGLAEDIMKEMPHQDMLAYAQAVQTKMRETVLKQIPKFLFDTSTSDAPEDFSPQQWRDFLTQVRRCMPVQHVVVDLAEKRAYDWEVRCWDLWRDFSQLTNLWNALASRLDPYPADPNKKFSSWRKYYDGRPDAGGPEEDAKWRNWQYYRVLAEFMPASSRADPDLCTREEIREYLDGMEPSASALTMAYVRADTTAKNRLERIGVLTRLGRPRLRLRNGGSLLSLSKWEVDLDVCAEFDLDDHKWLDLVDGDADEEADALIKAVRDDVIKKRVQHLFDTQMAHDLHLDLGLSSREAGDLEIDQVVDPRVRRRQKMYPVREDARVIYWTLVEQLLLYPSKPDAVKLSLTEIATKLEPIARKKQTTVIHRDGHLGALLRMTERVHDYSLLATRAAGLLDYVDLFRIDINFQLHEPPPSCYMGEDYVPPPPQSIMTHIADIPGIVVALMKHGAKPPPLSAEARSLAEIAKDQQNIHSSECTAALVTLSEAALSFLRACGVEVPAQVPPVGPRTAATPSAGAGAASGSTGVPSASGSASSSSSSTAMQQARELEKQKQSADKISSANILLEELRTRIKRLSAEDFASLRNAEKHAQGVSTEDIAAALSTQLNRVAQANETHPHPNRNGKKALFLVRNFVSLRYPEEDATFLILKALCQAAHQYGPNRQTCDPVLGVIGVLAGRVTEEDIEEAAQRKPTDADATARLTIPRNFLAQLQELHGAKTWHILEEGQRRLSLLPEDDRKLLPDLFDRIVNVDAAEHATNRLRGLFATQIMDDLEDTLEMKYGDELDDLPNMPRDLSQVLLEVYEIAEKFTKLFLSGDHMQAAFAPFIPSAWPRGASKSDTKKVDEGAELNGGEPDAKRQKTA
eukprot:g3157.t1